MSGQEAAQVVEGGSGVVAESGKQEEVKTAAEISKPEEAASTSSATPSTATEAPKTAEEPKSAEEPAKPAEETLKPQDPPKTEEPAKTQETKESENKESSSTADSQPIVKDVGVSADRNAKHRRFMEDAHTAEPNLTGDNKHGFFGVYDGHGGKSAALFCQANLHKILSEELKTLPDDADQETVKQVLRSAFAKTDAAMKESVPSAGACVVTCLIRKVGDKRFLYVANAGDARAVLSQKGVAKRLTIDHKPTNEDEIERISQAGGFISNGRVNGMVAITRSLGDHCMKDFISGEPYLDSLELSPDDDLLILACDGVWDVLTDQDAIELVRGEADCATMSKKLLIHAIKGGSTDNISVMVVSL